jgi:hypothetical protein
VVIELRLSGLGMLRVALARLPAVDDQITEHAEQRHHEHEQEDWSRPIWAHKAVSTSITGVAASPAG